MAKIHGQGGRLYVGIASGTAAAEPISYLNDWSIDFSTDKVDVTSFEDANKTYVTGKEDVQGTYSGFYDNATAQTYTAATDGTARRFYLYPAASTGSTGQYWFGTAFFDIKVKGGVSSAVAIDGTFVAASDVSKLA